MRSNSRGFYELDHESERVEVRIVDGDIEDVEKLEKWLGQVRRWMQVKQDERDGGTRWEFNFGVGVATGRLMVGKRARYRLDLIPTSVRKARLCEACRGPVEGECWKQKPNTWAGLSRSRFCVRCVESAPAMRPKLKVVTGGQAEQR